MNFMEHAMIEFSNLGLNLKFEQRDWFFEDFGVNFKI
jgi:hypothetical protein